MSSKTYKPIISLAEDIPAIESLGKEMFGLKFCPPVRNRFKDKQFTLEFTVSGNDSQHTRRQGLTFYEDGRIVTMYGYLDRVNMFKLVEVVKGLGYSA